MRLANFLLISAYVLGFHSQTSADTPQQCHQDDPNFNNCLKKLIERGFSVLINGDPQSNISATDPYVIPLVVHNATLENFATGSVIFQNMKIGNAGKFKIEDAKIDFDNLVLDLDVFLPKLSIKTEFKIDAKLLEIPIRSEGLLKGEITDLKLYCKVQLKIVEREGVKYLTASDLKARETISGGSVNIIVKDPEQQVVVDVIQNWFNENPKENYKLLDPIVESDGKLYYLPLVQSVLSLIESDIILSK